MSSVSYATPEDLESLRQIYEAGGEHWRNAVEEYAETLIDICSKWDPSARESLPKNPPPKKIGGETMRTLTQLSSGFGVTPSQVRAAFLDIASCENSQLRDANLGVLLTAVARGQQPDTIATLVRTALDLDHFLERPKIAIPATDRGRTVFVSGSGKKGYKTINVSTPAAIIAASLGASVVKVGSSSTASCTGSADFMDTLGYKNTLSDEEMAKVCAETGLGFFRIEELIPKLDSVYGNRFLAPNALSFALPAMLCPVSYDVLLYGFAHPQLELSGQVLTRLGVRDGMVYGSTPDGIRYIDEIVPHGNARIVHIQDGKSGASQGLDGTATPSVEPFAVKMIAQAPSAEENILHAVRVLQGQGQPAHRDILCTNAAAILLASSMCSTLDEGFQMSRSALAEGKVWGHLQMFIERVSGSSETLAALATKANG